MSLEKGMSHCDLPNVTSEQFHFRIHQEHGQNHFEKNENETNKMFSLFTL